MMIGPKFIVFNTLVDYLAIACANASNLILMRYKEIKNGITVQNKTGSVNYGTSKKAGFKAVMLSAMSRFILPLPTLILPTLANSFL